MRAARLIEASAFLFRIAASRRSLISLPCPTGSRRHQRSDGNDSDAESGALRVRASDLQASQPNARLSRAESTRRSRVSQKQRARPWKARTVVVHDDCPNRVHQCRHPSLPLPTNAVGCRSSPKSLLAWRVEIPSLSATMSAEMSAPWLRTMLRLAHDSAAACGRWRTCPQPRTRCPARHRCPDRCFWCALPPPCACAPAS